MSDVLITNRQAQLINVTLKDKSGKQSTKSLLPRSVTKVDAASLTESVFDLVRHGHLSVNVAK